VTQMALPDLDVARVQRWCAARVPEHARHQVRVECDIADKHLTILERRAPWREDYGPEWTSFPIARLRYTASTKTWTLYWRDRNLRFHRYDLLNPSPQVGDLLAELDRDPTPSSGANTPQPTTFSNQLEWGQLRSSQWGQFELTSPDSSIPAVRHALILADLG
jgi:hypothetical protein